MYLIKKVRATNTQGVTNTQGDIDTQEKTNLLHLNEDNILHVFIYDALNVEI